MLITLNYRLTLISTMKPSREYVSSILCVLRLVPYLLYQDYTLLPRVIRNCRVGFIYSNYYGPDAYHCGRIFEVAITVDALKLRNTIQLVGILRKYQSRYRPVHLLTSCR
jgi:hypothetical protein